MDQAEKIHEAFVELEKVKTQLNYLSGIVESEKGTLQREADRLRNEIEIVERNFREIIYDSEKGLLIRLDRLTQESLERKRTKQNIIGLWIAVGSVIVKTIIDFFKSN